jgi:hypothetical protein
MGTDMERFSEAEKQKRIGLQLQEAVDNFREEQKRGCVLICA